jgi:hypothetical protein
VTPERRRLREEIWFALSMSSKGVALAYYQHAQDKHEWVAGVERSTKTGKIVVTYEMSPLLLYFDGIDRWPIEVIEGLSELVWIPFEPKSPLTMLAETAEGYESPGG